MKNPYKTYRMKLITLSPIFIGSGGSSDLSCLQYVLTDNELKIIDESKLMNFLIKTNLLDDFLKFVTTTQYNSNEKKIAGNLSNWINENFRNKTLDIYSRSYKLTRIVKRNLNEIKTFIKNADGKPYIPGSSIKGAIRTAIYADLINSNVDNVEELLKKEMSYIKISDSLPISTEHLMFRQTQHQQLIKDNNSLKRNGYYRIDKKIMNVDNNLKEILREGIISRFSLTIKNGFRYDIDTLQKVLSDFYGKVLEENKCLDEIDNRFKTHINLQTGETPNINIGGQSGFNTKIILRSLSNSEHEYQERKKIPLQVFKKHHHNEEPIAPRCLKVVERYKQDSNVLMPLGWCNLSVEKEIDVSDITD